MAVVPSRFGYVLAASTGFAGSVSWANNAAARLFFRIVPRYSLPLVGVAIYATAVPTGQADVYLYYGMGGILWDPGNYASYLLSGYSINRVNYPASPGRFVLSGLNFQLAAGSGYWVGIRNGSIGTLSVFPGFDRRVSDWSRTLFLDYSSRFYSGSFTDFPSQFNAQILYRMPDGTIKWFEPLLTGGYNDEYTTSNLAVRFTVPEGLNLNVRGFTFGHFTKQGSPGGLYITLKQGNTTIAQSDPLTTLFTPPSTTAGLSFYIPLLNSPVLLSGGVTYDVVLGVNGTHDTSNRFAMKVVGVDTSAIPSWWTYRMVIGGTEYWSKVPTMFLVALDDKSPFG
jgi:hypothetical protein